MEGFYLRDWKSYWFSETERTFGDLFGTNMAAIWFVSRNHHGRLKKRTTALKSTEHNNKE